MSYEASLHFRPNSPTPLPLPIFSEVAVKTMSSSWILILLSSVESCWFGVEGGSKAKWWRGWREREARSKAETSLTTFLLEFLPKSIYLPILCFHGSLSSYSVHIQTPQEAQQNVILIKIWYLQPRQKLKSDKWWAGKGGLAGSQCIPEHGEDGMSPAS